MIKEFKIFERIKNEKYANSVFKDILNDISKLYNLVNTSIQTPTFKISEEDKIEYRINNWNKNTYMVLDLLTFKLMSDEIKDKRGTKKSKCLRRIVRNVFHPLKIELDSGWDDVDKKGAVDYVLDILNTFKNPSRIFNECEYYCLDILQSLIILPLEEQSFKHIGKYYKTFLKEWVKIENEISNEFYNLYILKEVINVAREVRADYMDEETREIAINIFRKGVYSAIEKVTKFCIPKNINFEKFLCSLFLLSQNIEGILYDVITTRMVEKEKEYEKMPLKSIEQIYAAIDVNISDEYKYNENTVFLIMDCINKDHKLFEIPNDEIDNINQMKNMMRGTYIYDLYINSI